MRVPDEILEYVVFLAPYTETIDTVDSRATGFFINYAGMTHLITAKHNAVKLGPKFTVRVNVPAGGYGLFSLHSAKWYFHPIDQFVDVAVTPLIVFLGAVGHKKFSTKDILSTSLVRDLNIGIGDEVINCGLFHEIAGQRRITPLARFGHIAMMPTEKIRISLSDEQGLPIVGEANAYLIDAKAIGGFSGSPVLVHRYSPRARARDWNHSFWLFGLVHGHWEIDDIPKPFLQRMNEGIVHVVPAQKILEVLKSPDLVNARKEIKRG